jgi:taurine dioxygenase
MTIHIDPISEHIGSDVYGIDITKNVDDNTLNWIKSKLDERLVLAFREQPEFSYEDHLKFSERFGPHQRLPHAKVMEEHPDMGVVIMEPHHTVRDVVGKLWHSDSSFLEKPPFGAIMKPIILPPAGGDTAFANMYAVYDMLGPKLQEMLLTMKAVHMGARAFVIISKKNNNKPNIKDYSEITNDDYIAAEQEMIHPVIRKRPITGRCALYINPIYTFRFVGRSREESEPLLNYLYSLVDKSGATCRVKWDNSTIVIWDNRFTQHRAIYDYQGQHRKMIRTTIQGERPV